MDRSSLQFADTEIKYMRHAWRLLGGDELGSLPSDKIGKVLRAFGKNPSEQDIQYLKFEFGFIDNKRLAFSEFVDIYRRYQPKLETAEQLNEAFKVFDKDETGTIKSTDLRDILTRLGEPLSEYEVNKLFQMADTERTGNIKYADLSKKLMSDNRPLIQE